MVPTSRGQDPVAGGVSPFAVIPAPGLATRTAAGRGQAPTRNRTRHRGLRTPWRLQLWKRVLPTGVEPASLTLGPSAAHPAPGACGTCLGRPDAGGEAPVPAHDPAFTPDLWVPPVMSRPGLVAVMWTCTTSALGYEPW